MILLLYINVRLYSYNICKVGIFSFKLNSLNYIILLKCILRLESYNTYFPSFPFVTTFIVRSKISLILWTPSKNNENVKI